MTSPLTTGERNFRQLFQFTTNRHSYKQDKDDYVQRWRQRSNTEFGETQNNSYRTQLINKIKRYKKHQLLNNQIISDSFKFIQPYGGKEGQLKKLMNRIKVLEHILAKRNTAELKD